MKYLLQIFLSEIVKIFIFVNKRFHRIKLKIYNYTLYYQYLKYTEKKINLFLNLNK